MDRGNVSPSARRIQDPGQDREPGVLVGNLRPIGTSVAVGGRPGSEAVPESPLALRRPPELAAEVMRLVGMLDDRYRFANDPQLMRWESAKHVFRGAAGKGTGDARAECGPTTEVKPAA
jgi:hypothetical protein